MFGAFPIAEAFITYAALSSIDPVCVSHDAMKRLLSYYFGYVIKLVNNNLNLEIKKLNVLTNPDIPKVQRLKFMTCALYSCKKFVFKL